MESYSAAMRRQFVTQEQIILLNKLIKSNPDIQHTLEQGKNSGGFYNALYNGMGKDWSHCPWLEKGAYISVDGTMTSCCFVKDSKKFGFGKIDEDDSHMLLQKRTELCMKLHAGIIPDNCQGCELAVRALKKY